jgi:hypothetical protein
MPSLWKSLERGLIGVKACGDSGESGNSLSVVSSLWRPCFGEAEGKSQKDVDDIKAILKFARVNLEAVRRRAEKEGTIKILEEIMAQQE